MPRPSSVTDIEPVTSDEPPVAARLIRFFPKLIRTALPSMARAWMSQRQRSSDGVMSDELILPYSTTPFIWLLQLLELVTTLLEERYQTVRPGIVKCSCHNRGWFSGLDLSGNLWSPF